MRQLTRALAERGFAQVDRGGAEPLKRFTTLTEYEEGWPYPVAFPPARPATTLAADDRANGRAPAARRRDREVRARHVLLQRRQRGPAARRAARARAVAARRPDLRPAARDERARGRGRVHRRVARGCSALRDHQLRQRRHGRPHRRDRSGGARGRDRRRVPRAGRRRSARSGRRLRRSRPTTATPTTCSSPTAAPTPRIR